MGKSKQKISNWKLYNLALVKRGSLTLWMDEQAIKHWHCQTHHGRRGRGFHYSDRAIETALMLKSVLQVAPACTEGFINSLFQLMDKKLLIRGRLHNWIYRLGKPFPKQLMPLS